LNAVVTPDPVDVDFAKAIVGDTTHNSARLWFAWHGRDPIPDGRCVCEIERLLPPRKRKLDSPEFPLPGKPLPRERWTVPVDFARAARQSNTVAWLIPDLRPATTYRYALRYTAAGEVGIPGLGRVLARGEFTTAPVASTGLRFVFGSCHQPTTAKSLGRWEVLKDRQDYDLMLLIGDQIYEDKIERMGGTWEEKYWNRYHQYWVHRPMREVLRRTPTYMIFDDHEVKDDWGTQNKNDVLEPGREPAALKAYDDFQQAHNPGGVQSRVYHYGFRRGPAAFYVLDLRSNRKKGDAFPVLGGPQFNDFQDWANGPARKADIVFVVATVPIAYLPVQEVRRLLDAYKSAGGSLAGRVGAVVGGATFGALGAALGAYIGHRAVKKEIEEEYRDAGVAGLYDSDMADMWALDRNQWDLRRVLETLFDLANDVQADGELGSRPRAVIVLGGDVHYGAIHAIVSKLPKHARNNRILQLTSSPISHAPPDSTEMGVRALQVVVSHIKPGKDISERHVARFGKDLEALAKHLYGETPANFPLDDQGEKVFWAEFQDLLTERNFGRVGVERISAERRAYRISLAIEGDSGAISRSVEIDLSALAGLPPLSSDSRPPVAIVEGDLIKAPGDPAVFLVWNSVRRRIPDEATLLSRWRWDQVKTVPQEVVDEIPRGPDLPSVAAPAAAAEGDLIKGSDRPERYLVEFGERRRVPDETTLLSWWTSDQVKTVPQEVVDAIPRGPDLPKVAPPAVVVEGDLIKSSGDPAVFLVRDGVRRWIPDEATLLSRWTSDQVKTVPPEVVDAIPRGPDLPSVSAPPAAAAEGDLIKGPYLPEVSLVEDGRRHRVPDEATFLSRWTSDQVKTVPDETIAMTSRGPDLPSVAAPPVAVVEGDLIQAPGDPAVFVVREGVRRWIPDEATLLSRWSWDWVRTLPREAVEAIPRGPDLTAVLVPLSEGVAEGGVIKGSDRPELYLVEFGERRLVPDEATFLSRWRWDQIKTVPQAILDAIRLGPDLPPVRVPLGAASGASLDQDMSSTSGWSFYPPAHSVMVATIDQGRTVFTSADPSRVSVASINMGEPDGINVACNSLRMDLTMRIDPTAPEPDSTPDNGRLSLNRLPAAPIIAGELSQIALYVRTYSVILQATRLTDSSGTVQPVVNVEVPQTVGPEYITWTVTRDTSGRYTVIRSDTGATVITAVESEPVTGSHLGNAEIRAIDQTSGPNTGPAIFFDHLKIKATREINDQWDRL
jgi:hypothetical protein